MVKLIITSGCMLEIQGTSPNSRSYPWNKQCLSPNHIKIQFIFPTFVKIQPCILADSWRWSLDLIISQSYLPIYPAPHSERPAYHNCYGCPRNCLPPCFVIAMCESTTRTFWAFSFLPKLAEKFLPVRRWAAICNVQVWYIWRLLSCCIIDPFTRGWSLFYLRLVPCFQQLWCNYSTHLKNMSLKMGIFPPKSSRVESKKYWQPQPRKDWEKNKQIGRSFYPSFWAIKSFIEWSSHVVTKLGL